MSTGGGDAEAPPASTDTAARIGAKDARPVEEINPKDTKALEGADLKEIIKLKRFYGKWVLRIMTAQLVVVNAVFIVYAWAGYGWEPPERVVQIWLVATFVQIVGIVIGITKSLFPKGGDS